MKEKKVEIIFIGKFDPKDISYLVELIKIIVLGKTKKEQKKTRVQKKIISIDVIPCYVLEKKGDRTNVATYISYDSKGFVTEKLFPSILFEGIKEGEKAFFFTAMYPGMMEQGVISAKRYRKSFFWLKTYLENNKKTIKKADL